MSKSFIEFHTGASSTILIKLENITLVKKNPREYPKYEITYSVFVNNWSWQLKEEEGESVYNQYKEWLGEQLVQQNK